MVGVGPYVHTTQVVGVGPYVHTTQVVGVGPYVHTTQVVGVGPYVHTTQVVGVGTYVHTTQVVGVGPYVHTTQVVGGHTLHGLRRFSWSTCVQGGLAYCIENGCCSCRRQKVTLTEQNMSFRSCVLAFRARFYIFIFDFK